MKNQTTNKSLVYEYLKQEPRFRERSSKNRGIADILIDKYNLPVDRWLLSDIISDAYSMDRAWRMILQDNVELRGSDYDEKNIIEQESQLELGYDPLFNQDIKQLKNIK